MLALPPPEEPIVVAVYSMVMEGAISGLWSFKDKALGQHAINAYIEDKQIQAVPVYGSDGELEGFIPSKPDQTPASAKAEEGMKAED